MILNSLYKTNSFINRNVNLMLIECYESEVTI